MLVCCALGFFRMPSYCIRGGGGPYKIRTIKPVQESLCTHNNRETSNHGWLPLSFRWVYPGTNTRQTASHSSYYPTGWLRKIPARVCHLLCTIGNNMAMYNCFRYCLCIAQVSVKVILSLFDVPGTTERNKTSTTVRRNAYWIETSVSLLPM